MVYSSRLKPCREGPAQWLTEKTSNVIVQISRKSATAPHCTALWRSMKKMRSLPTSIAGLPQQKRSMRIPGRHGCGTQEKTCLSSGLRFERGYWRGWPAASAWTLCFLPCRPWNRKTRMLTTVSLKLRAWFPRNNPTHACSASSNRSRAACRAICLPGSRVATAQAAATRCGQRSWARATACCPTSTSSWEWPARSSRERGSCSPVLPDCLPAPYPWGWANGSRSRVPANSTKNRSALKPRKSKTVPEEETEELVLIYQARGMDEETARLLATRLMSNPDSALDTLARDELGVNPEDLGGSAWQAAITSFLLFAAGAIVPVVPFLFLEGRHGRCRERGRERCGTLCRRLCNHALYREIGALLRHYDRCSLVWPRLLRFF